MDIFLSDFVLWPLSGLVLVLAFWAGIRPVFKWEINTGAFLEAVHKLIKSGNLDRAVKLMNAAPSAPVVQIILVFVDEGENSAKELRGEYRRTFNLQRLRLAFAGVVSAFAMALAGYTAFLEPVFIPLTVSSVVAILVVMKGLASIRKIQRDCDYVVSTWLGELVAAAPKEVGAKIGGLDW